MDEMNGNINGEFNPNNRIESQLFSQESQTQQQSQSSKKDDNAEIEQIAHIITDLDRRLRTLEERYSNIRKKLQLTDQNMIEAERSFVKELRTLNDDTLKIKKQVNDYSEKMMMLSEEVSESAKKIDLKIIEKYLALWNPQTFVTRKELKTYLMQKNPPIIKVTNDE